VTGERNARLSWAAAVLALAWHATNGLFAALMGRFPATLDELQHLSFIRWMEREPRLLPRYQDLRVLDAGAERFTATANYLNHPSPYYLLMGLADRALGGSILGLRLADLGLSLCAVAVMLIAGFRVLTGWRERAVFAAVLVLFPKLGVVAGLISNDNAALLAAGVAFLGLIEWQRRPVAGTALLLGFGLALCGWTKLTVLLMAGFAVVVAEALRLWTDKARPRAGAYAILVGGLLVAAAPSLANLAAYGRPLHHSDAFYVPPVHRVALSFGRYALVFLRNMEEKWAALEPSGPAQQFGLYLVLGLAASAVVVGLGRMRGRLRADDSAPAWRAACGLILATLPVLVLHLYFGWRTFVEDGFVEMAQTRYYYGVWPGFALGLTLLWREIPAGLGRAAATVLAAWGLAAASLAVLGLALLVRGQTAIG
jgi:hypothetical protein